MPSKRCFSLLTGAPVSLWRGRGKEETAFCLWKPHPTPSMTKKQAALRLRTTLSLYKYSSEGICLNRENVKLLYRQTHNIQFSALSSMRSQRNISHCLKPLRLQSPFGPSSCVIKLFPQKRALCVQRAGLFLFRKEYVCMAQCEPDKM